MELTAAKLLVAFATLVISFLSCIAPLKVIKVDELYFSIGNLLAAGILLAAGLVHQLPDSIEAFEDAMEGSDFPISSFLAGLTFCAFIILEEYLHTEFEEHNPFENDGSFHIHNHDHGHHHDHHMATEKTPFNNKHELENDQINADYVVVDDDVVPVRETRTSRESFKLISSSSGSSKGVEIALETFIGKTTSTTTKNSPRNPTSTRQGGKKVGGCETKNQRSQSICKSNRPRFFDRMRNASFESEHPIHVHEDHLVEHMHGSLLSSVLLLLALSIHSFLEAFAIGVATDKAGVITITTAILAHKAFAGYALGSSMVASHMKPNHVLVLAVVFSCCTPIGVIAGMLFLQLLIVDTENGGSDSAIAMGVIQAVVAGTFLYVSIVEIGMKEIMMHRESAEMNQSHMTPTKVMSRKLAAFLLGYLLMSMLAIWV